MKTKIFIYLFTFLLLLLIFQSVNNSSVSLSQEKKLIQKKKQTEILKDSIQKLKRKISEDIYFSLENNKNAQVYFSDQHIPSLLKNIKKTLYSINSESGKNSLLPQSKLNEKLLLDKVKVLNQKWLIANFSNGKNKGELFIEYKLTDSREIEFKTLDYFFYP